MKILRVRRRGRSKGLSRSKPGVSQVHVLQPSDEQVRMNRIDLVA
jgi:hypothetical protein